MNLAQTIRQRLAIIRRVHGETMYEVDSHDARVNGRIPHCDCSRCMMGPKVFSDQFKPNGERK